MELHLSVKNIRSFHVWGRQCLPQTILDPEKLLSLELFAAESAALRIGPVLFVIPLAAADTVLVRVAEVFAELAHKAFLKTRAGVRTFAVNGNDHL